mgnify:FL=1
MYRIALNVAISHYRKEKKGLVHTDFYNEDSVYTIADELEYDPSLDINISLLQDFIDKQNALNKAMLLLYLEEKSYEEIAAILGITKTNVATKISRLKQQLKKEFKNR